MNGAVRFSEVAGGGFTSCGLSGGAAYCWGSNANGQVGDSTTTNRAQPVAVRSTIVFRELTIGNAHACGLTAGGVAYCWGANYSGQLGNSGTADSWTPVVVAGGRTFQSLSAAAGNFTCGVTTSGDAYCWGYNPQGQLGNGTKDTAPHPAPELVQGGLTFSSISTGSSHTCAVTTTKEVYCWGWNSTGQLGNGGTAQTLTPVKVTALTDVTMVVARLAHTCALVSGGQAYCCGANSRDGQNYGQLGDGTYVDRPLPTLVSGGYLFARLTAGDLHTCGVTSTGAGVCWGMGRWGQLGAGTTADGNPTPAFVLMP